MVIKLSRSYALRLKLIGAYFTTLDDNGDGSRDADDRPFARLLAVCRPACLPARLFSCLTRSVASRLARSLLWPFAGLAAVARSSVCPLPAQQPARPPRQLCSLRYSNIIIMSSTHERQMSDIQKLWLANTQTSETLISDRNFTTRHRTSR